MLFVGARLAGEGVRKNAVAGKPGSYEKQFARRLISFVKPMIYTSCL